jgi:pimeloyl-ACP methyl ester carboxylesterase
MAGMTRSVTMPDRRELVYEEYGDPGGTPVLSFHGGLSSRLDAAPAHDAALSLGVRIISPDRPGMGRSTFQPGRRLLDWPDDVAALTAALAIDRFAVMGWSCGGPYAAVCAARMGDRVTAVGLLSSAVPLDLFGTTKGLSSDDRILLFLIRRAPRLASALLRVSIADATETRLYREIRRTFPAVDRAALDERGSMVDAVAFIKESMRQGTAGCLQDYRVFGDPWGFELGEITAPVHLWEGTEDHTGPPEYRELLLRHLPDAHLSLIPGEGHVSLLQHQARAILAGLTTGTDKWSQAAKATTTD